MNLLKMLKRKFRELLLRLSFKTNNKYLYRTLRLLAFSFRSTHGQRDARLWARPGDVVLCCGMWRAESLESWVRTIAPINSKDDNEGFVVVLEADPKNCEILAYEAERRNLSGNCMIINVALWSHKTTLTLQRRIISDANIIKEADAIGRNPAMDLSASQRDEMEIQADSIDNILKENSIEKIDHVHMTIGASEVEALKGMSNLLKNKNLRLYVKSITSYRNGGVLFDDVIKITESAGMKNHIIHRTPEGVGKEMYSYFK